MRHGIDGRKFGRNTSHRIAMFRNIANAVITQEQVITTVPKAKETRRVVDRLITLGKSGTLSSRRLAFARTRDERVVTKLFGMLAERYGKRAGGYTRVLRLSEVRRGDAAEMAVLELVDRPELKRTRDQLKRPVAAKGKKGKADAHKHDHDHDHDNDHGHEHGHKEGAVDPFKGIRKLFTGKRKGAGKLAGEEAVKTHTHGHPTTGRKTSTRGSSGKKGS